MEKSSRADADHSLPRLCDRCLVELVDGRGEYYEINIDARVDASPPILDSPAISREEMDRQWGETIRDLESISQVDAENQVFCKRKIVLCASCFHVWIENPAGDM
ncbi:MAG: hypothetical protein AAF802_17455 [Planctomycetota bacterium]